MIILVANRLPWIARSVENADLSTTSNLIIAENYRNREHATFILKVKFPTLWLGSQLYILQTLLSVYRQHCVLSTTNHNARKKVFCALPVFFSNHYQLVRLGKICILNQRLPAVINWSLGLCNSCFCLQTIGRRCI